MLMLLWLRSTPRLGTAEGNAATQVYELGRPSEPLTALNDLISARSFAKHLRDAFQVSADSLDHPRFRDSQSCRQTVEGVAALDSREDAGTELVPLNRRHRPVGMATAATSSALRGRKPFQVSLSLC